MGVRTGTYDAAAYYTLNTITEQDLGREVPRDQKKHPRYPVLSPGLLRPESATQKSVERIWAKLSDALSPDMPASTGVLFQAGVVAPAAKTEQVVVNFAIDPHTLAFERKPDGLAHASLSCAVVAYSEKGSLVKKEINSITAALKADAFEKVMQGYFSCKRTIELKPGHYTLTWAW
jgi:hypothetical protein